MIFTTPSALMAALRETVVPLSGTPDDFGLVMRRVGNAPLVLIGEASHGTHEFYRIRAQITKRLITEKGFTAVAIEGDWPDAYRVDRYVRGLDTDGDATMALAGFRRFPQWMWRNADVLDFVGWLRAHNDQLPAAQAVGFYGLDLYSLHASMDAVLRYLRTVDPPAARRAAERYGCFFPDGSDPQRYGHAASLGLRPTCENEVLAQLVELRRAAGEYARRDGRLAADDQFFAEQNALVVANAERYYRTMFTGHTSSWNLRDRHMDGVLASLRDFLGREHGRGKVVVWAHNSHVGDARATEMSAMGQLNLGQLARHRLGWNAVLVGLTMHHGTVTAASQWDEAAQQMTVRPALPGSVEHLFHEVGVRNFVIDLSRENPTVAALRAPRLERAIGVIYRPDTERQSHYLQASLAEQFDIVLHYDATRAVEPMERSGVSDRAEVPETYPAGV